MRGRGLGVVGASANEYSCAHGAQINFGDLTPYLTYGYKGSMGRKRIWEMRPGIMKCGSKIWQLESLRTRSCQAKAWNKKNLRLKHISAVVTDSEACGSWKKNVE